MSFTWSLQGFKLSQKVAEQHEEFGLSISVFWRDQTPTGTRQNDDLNTRTSRRSQHNANLTHRIRHVSVQRPGGRRRGFVASLCYLRSKRFRPVCMLPLFLWLFTPATSSLFSDLKPDKYVSRHPNRSSAHVSHGIRYEYFSGYSVGCMLR